MLKYIIKVIVFGGLSMAVMVPAAMSQQQPATKDDITRLGHDLGDKIDRQTAAIKDLIGALQERFPPRREHVSSAPPPPTRIVHVHHHHYYPQYWRWCPPPWFVGY
jgi:hypothetical protein